MKKIFALLTGLFISFSGYSQSCLPEGIIFSTQDQIDSFQLNYPGCTEIGGNVEINGDSSITNLNGLNTLTSINGNLFIYNNKVLGSLTGLEGLTTINGYLRIAPSDWYNDYYNPLLTNLNGLNNLISAGGLVIYGNSALISLAGLESLTTIGGDLRIGAFSHYEGGFGNPVLTDLSGLNALTSINNNLEIQYNNTLNDLAGFENLNHIGGIIIRSNRALKNLTGLEGIISTNDGGIEIRNNDSLNDLTGLSNLINIGGYLYMDNNNSLSSLLGLDGLRTIDGGLFIENCAALTSLINLDGLNHVGKTIWIAHNSGLSTLSGLDSIAPGSIMELTIYDNSSLSACNVKSICDYLASSYGTIEIHDNETGCDSKQEVEDACGVGLEESAASSWQSTVKISPNPASTNITIELPSTLPVNNTVLSIYNVNAQLVLSHRITEFKTTIDIATLPRGMYFVRMSGEGEVRVAKFVTLGK
jgi:hypothetical protein